MVTGPYALSSPAPHLSISSLFQIESYESRASLSILKGLKGSTSTSALRVRSLTDVPLPVHGERVY